MARTVTALSATRYIVACKTKREYKKLFQIGFTKSDSSLIVCFPYFRQCAGIVGVATLAPNLSYPTTFTIGKHFPATNHAVKYSHHPSGRAHFSLTGKVTSSVGRSSVPLSVASGHTFTVMLQSLGNFKNVGPTDAKAKDRQVIPYRVDQDDIFALKFVGHIWREAELAKRVLATKAATPWLRLLAPDGSVKQGILMATPIQYENQRSFIAMSMEHIPYISKDKGFMFSFMGGFDAPSVGYDNTKETSFLLAMYPAPSATDGFVRSSIDIAT